MKVFDKKNEVEAVAKELENGKIEVTYADETEKVLAYSTFKRWFKEIDKREERGGTTMMSNHGEIQIRVGEEADRNADSNKAPENKEEFSVGQRVCLFNEYKEEQAIDFNQAVIIDLAGQLATVATFIDGEIVETPVSVEKFQGEYSELLDAKEEKRYEKLEAFVKGTELPEEEEAEEEPKQEAPKQEEKKSPESYAGFDVTDYKMEQTPKSFKFFIELDFGKGRMQITEYGGYITDVRLVDVYVKSEEDPTIVVDELYKSPKMSVRDTLEHMGFDAVQIKEISKEIRQARKAAKQKVQ